MTAHAPRFSHAQIVGLACEWLASMGMHTILPEPAVRELQESPDVIAWRGAESHMVEVKVTRKDVSHDHGKASRSGGLALGRCRWMATPPGLVFDHDLPAGWGLVELGGAVPVVLVEPLPFDAVNREAEIVLLVAAFRRVVFPRRQYPPRHWVPGVELVEDGGDVAQVVEVEP